MSFLAHARQQLLKPKKYKFLAKMLMTWFYSMTPWLVILKQMGQCISSLYVLWNSLPFFPLPLIVLINAIRYSTGCNCWPGLSPLEYGQNTSSLKGLNVKTIQTEFSSPIQYWSSLAAGLERGFMKAFDRPKSTPCAALRRVRRLGLFVRNQLCCCQCFHSSLWKPVIWLLASVEWVHCLGPITSLLGLAMCAHCDPAKCDCLNVATWVKARYVITLGGINQKWSAILFCVALLPTKIKHSLFFVIFWMERGLSQWSEQHYV